MATRLRAGAGPEAHGAAVDFRHGGTGHRSAGRPQPGCLQANQWLAKPLSKMSGGKRVRAGKLGKGRHGTKTIPMHL